MREYMRSRTFWLLFLSAFTAVCVVSAGIFIYFWQAEISDKLQASLRESEAAMEAISDFLDDMLEDGVVLAGKLRNTAWVQKLCATPNVFNEEFDYVRRREVAADYLFYTSLDAMITERFLVYPYKDICIGERVFTDIFSYFGILGVPVQMRQVLLDEICSTAKPSLLYASGRDYADSLLLCFPVETIRHSRVYLCSFLNSARLQEIVRSMMPSGVAGVRLSSEDGSMLFQIGDCQEDASIKLYTRDGFYIAWRYEYYIDISIATVSYAGGNRQPVIQVLLAAPLCLMSAWVLALALYRPVAKLMNQAGLRRALTRNQLNDYRALGEHIDRITERYRQSRRVALLYRLLSGYFQHETASADMPETQLNDHDFFKVLLYQEVPGTCNEQKRNIARSEVEHFFRAQNILSETVDNTDASLVTIAAFSSEEAARQFSIVPIHRALEGCYVIFTGTPEKGLVGISISYQSAREKMYHLSGASMSRFYFPLEWEKQFLDALFSKRAAVVKGILIETRQENDRRIQEGQCGAEDYWRLLGMLAADMRRGLEESGMESETLQKALAELAVQEDPDEMWRILLELCSYIETERRQAPSDALRLLAYLDDHLADHDLSLTVLEGIFGYSANTVNKLVKQVCGMTFYAYLTQRRIEHAKELLDTGRYKITQVAQMTGYDTEYSFRRAFARYTGVKAQNYATSPSAGAVEQRPEDEATVRT